MKFWQFWGDLSIWNKFGLAFIAAVVIVTLTLVLT